MQYMISVLLPYSNNQNTIEDAIKSVLEQSYENFELLLINNQSTDNSEQIACDYASVDKRIKLLSEPRNGVGYALNTGLEDSLGEFIIRLDADDTCMEGRFETQVGYLVQHADVDAVSCCVRHVSNEEGVPGKLNYVIWSNKIIGEKDIQLNRFIDCPVVHSSVCYRKEVFQKIGGFQQGYMQPDYEFVLRMFDNKITVHKLPDYLVEYFDYPERNDKMDDAFNSQAFHEVKSMYIYNFLLSANKWHPHVAVWGAGRTPRRWFSYLHELGVWPGFFIDVHANEPKNVIQINHTPPAGNNFILSYISNFNARNKIKEFLQELGYTEGEDFMCVA